MIDERTIPPATASSTPPPPPPVRPGSGVSVAAPATFNPRLEAMAVADRRADVEGLPAVGQPDESTPATIELSPGGLDGTDEPTSALSRLPRLPFEAALVLGTVLILLVALVISSRSGAADARAERDDALAAVADLERRLADTEQAMSGASDDAASAAARLADLEADLAAVGMDTDGELADALAALTLADERIVEVEAELAAATDGEAERAARIEELEIQNDALRAERGGASLLVGDDFARLVGEFVASADGLRIDAVESRCLGRFVIDELGLDAVGAGLHSDRTDATNGAVIDAMVAGSAVCGIDPSRVFAQ